MKMLKLQPGNHHIAIYSDYQRSKQFYNEVPGSTIKKQEVFSARKELQFLIWKL